MARPPALEASALALGRDLRAHGHRDLAAALLEVVPETGTLKDEAGRTLVAQRLHLVAGSDRVAPRLRARAARLAVLAASDPLVRHGRTGTVWIAWSGEDGEDGEGGECAADPAGEGAPGPGYVVAWVSERGDEDWCEDGPGFDDLRDALAWARARTDAVVVRPAWDEGTYYWAGHGHDPRALPPLDEFRA